MNICVLMLTMLTQVPAPPPQTGTAIIEGIVVKFGSSEPISGVDLELTRQAVTPAQPSAPGPPGPGAPGATPAAPYSAKSGADGRFAFRNIPAGSYKLVGARIGGLYTPTEYGQRGMLGRGTFFPVAEGEQRKDIRLEMAPTGTITGRIMDADGRPVGHAAVMAFSTMYRRGQRLMNLAQMVHSDDRGEFRIFSLVPGRYYVGARPEDPTRRTIPLSVFPPGRVQTAERVETPVISRRALPTGEIVEETYRIVYYGGGTDPERAAGFDLGPGANVGGVDIRIAEGTTPSRHIRGRALTTAGGPFPAAVQVRAMPRVWSPDVLVPISTTDAAGNFDIAGAIPGTYFVWAVTVADPAVRNSLPMVGVVSVEVDNKDIDGILVVPVPAPMLPGRVVIEGRENDPDMTRIQVSLTRDPEILGLPPRYQASPAANGAFNIQTFNADWRVNAESLPANTYIKSIRKGTTDLLSALLHIEGSPEGQLEIVIGTDPGTLEGRVFDDRRQPAVNVTVALVPEMALRRRWDLYKTTVTDLSGKFTLRGIFPGDYKVFAWEEVEENSWQDPEFLRNDEGRGMAIRIAPSGKDSGDLTVIPAKRR